MKYKTVLDKFEKYGIFFFSNIDNDSLVKYLGIFIILVFVRKKYFLLFFVYIQGKFVANIKEKVSKKLLGFYVSCPFPFHLNNNPAQLTRNTTNSIDGLSIYILRLVELLKESLAILVILILLSFVNLPITLIIFLIFSFLGFLYINTIRPSYRKKAKANENYKISLIQTINETFGAIKKISNCIIKNLKLLVITISLDTIMKKIYSIFLSYKKYQDFYLKQLQFLLLLFQH